MDSSVPALRSARNVAQSDIGDGGVEDLHERSQRYRERDDPRVIARLPGKDLVMFGVSHELLSSCQSSVVSYDSARRGNESAAKSSL